MCFTLKNILTYFLTFLLTYTSIRVSRPYYPLSIITHSLSFSYISFNLFSGVGLYKYFSGFSGAGEVYLSTVMVFFGAVFKYTSPGPEKYLYTPFCSVVYVFLGDNHALLDFIRHFNSVRLNSKGEYVVIAVKETPYDFKQRNKDIKKCKIIVLHFTVYEALISALQERPSARNSQKKEGIEIKER